MNRPTPELRLPGDFVFGTTSAAYAVEGAAASDGRTASIWDVVAAAPGRTVDGTAGAEAIGHYHRLDSDIELLTGLGVDAHRFSVSWSRVQPGGRGPANESGLDYYDRLVDLLLQAGIAPWVTLYHWDLPVELMADGGWLNRDTAGRLADLAVLVAGRIGDRVRAWATLGDPLHHMAYGHALGVDAPGLTLLGGAFAATHHLLVGHAGARDALLAADADAAIGIANSHTSVRPATGSAADRRAALSYDIYHNRQFAEPLLLGRYPRQLRHLAAPGLVQDGDLAAISAPLSFYGVDFHGSTVVRAAPDNMTIGFDVLDVVGPTDSASLTGTLIDLTRRYPRLPPLFVTENAAVDSDPETGPGTDLETDTDRDTNRDTEVGRAAGQPEPDDAHRIAHLDGHLDAVAAAVAAGVDVRGYFYRGLLDGWEGTEGHTRPSGLVRVDPESGQRTPRRSYGHYRELINDHRTRRAVRG